MNQRVVKSDTQFFFSEEHLSIWGHKTPDPLTPISLVDNCIDEIAAMAGRVDESQLPHVTLSDLPGCADLIAEVRTGLFTGSGCILIDRFPVERFDTQTNRRVAGIFSNLISPLMAQDVAGTLLYDVIDEGAAESKTTRRSKTNQAQPFHTDGPWFTIPPNLIGLFCIQPAVEGGLSQVSSLQHTLTKLIEEPQWDLTHFCEDLHWNKMGQFQSGDQPYNELPMLDAVNGHPLMRHYADYVRTGHELSKHPISNDKLALLEQIDRQLTYTACQPFRLEAGQFQYVNNWTVAHARAGFEDKSIGSQSGRHLVRLWNRHLPQEEHFQATR